MEGTQVQEYTQEPTHTQNEGVQKAAPVHSAPAEPKEPYRTPIIKFTDIFMDMLTNQFEQIGMPLCNYQKTCVYNSLTAIYNLMDANNININNDDLDRSSITDSLIKVAMLQLNPLAAPNEVFFRTRTVRRKQGVQDVYITRIEADVEGDGNEILVARYGRDVKTVHNYWIVRECDHFEYPKYRGIDVEPPIWRPSSEGGRVLRIVYPITKVNGMTEYHIAERADVIKNLAAHIKNNLQKETFGLAKSVYKADDQQKTQINNTKDSIILHVQSIGLDEALRDPSAQHAQFISPAWKEELSREAMIIRKMRNNILKKIPKDFSNPYAQTQYHELNTYRNDIAPNHIPKGTNYYDQSNPPHDTSQDMYEAAKNSAAFVDESEIRGDGHV